MWKTIRNARAFFRKLSLNTEKNWHQNKGAKRRDSRSDLEAAGDGSVMGQTYAKNTRFGPASCTAAGQCNIDGIGQNNRRMTSQTAVWRRQFPGALGAVGHWPSMLARCTYCCGMWASATTFFHL